MRYNHDTTNLEHDQDHAMENVAGYRRILIATDFSPSSEAALKQAVWIARRSGAQLVLAHALPDLLGVVHSASADAKLDLLYGEGEKFQREVSKTSLARMRRMVADLGATDLDIRYETLIGKPYVEIPYAVQQQGYDLVVAGTRGYGPFTRFFIGSTAKRLIRHCPCSVWVVKAEHVGPPKAVLAATDFSEVSRRAVLQGLWVAQQVSAEFHLVHVIESLEIPDEVLDKFSEGKAFRQKVAEEARLNFEQFIESLNVDLAKIQVHQTTATPWEEIGRLAMELNIDLIAIGTIGRSGIRGMLLGNTAEKILETCDSSILTVKPVDSVSPIS
ncbi:MAG: universal stress protein [Planctomycetaceae bacterium]